MSAGDLKTQGGQGKNFPFQHRNLQLLGQLVAAVTGLAPAGGFATEATALSILAAIQNGRDFEQNLVIDTQNGTCVGPCPTYVEIRIWNGVSFDPPTYYNAAGAAVVPVGPLEYVNPQFVLEDILQQLVAANGLLTTIDGDTSSLATNVDTTLSSRATEATLLLALAQLTAINADLDVALSTRASEVTLAAVQTLLTGATRTPSLARVTDNTGVPAGAKRVSFYSSGTANATVLGAILKPGETVTFTADDNKDTLGAFTYDATAPGAELVISKVV